MPAYLMPNHERGHPQTGRYSLSGYRLTQVGGGLTVLILGTMLSVYWIREARKKKRGTSGGD